MNWGRDAQLQRSAQDELLRQQRAREFAERTNPKPPAAPAPAPQEEAWTKS